MLCWHCEVKKKHNIFVSLICKINDWLESNISQIQCLWCIYKGGKRQGSLGTWTNGEIVRNKKTVIVTHLEQAAVFRDVQLVLSTAIIQFFTALDTTRIFPTKYRNWLWFKHMTSETEMNHWVFWSSTEWLKKSVLAYFWWKFCRYFQSSVRSCSSPSWEVKSSTCAGWGKHRLLFLAEIIMVLKELILSHH